jgi:hypothetical protein
MRVGGGGGAGGVPDDLFISDLGGAEGGAGASGATTEAVGEEGRGAAGAAAPGATRTTLAVGEEGRPGPIGSGGMTTLAVGEEGRGDPDIPGPVLTEAIGEVGREYAKYIEKRIDSENDAGLMRTVAGLSGVRGIDIDACIGQLARGKRLEKLAEELILNEREFMATHPNVRWVSPRRQLEAAIASGSPETRRLFEAAIQKFDKPMSNATAGKKAGEEVAREILLGFRKGDRGLVEASAREIIAPLASGFGSSFGKAKLDAAVKELAGARKLDDLVRALKKDAPALLRELAKAVEEHGNRATRAAWKAAGGPRPEPVFTTMAVGEEGRPGPGPGGTVTTLAVGEEGRPGPIGSGGMTTMAVGEEGRGTPP